MQKTFVRIDLQKSKFFLLFSCFSVSFEILSKILFKTSKLIECQFCKYDFMIAKDFSKNHSCKKYKGKLWKTAISISLFWLKGEIRVCIALLLTFVLVEDIWLNTSLCIF